MILIALQTIISAANEIDPDDVSPGFIGFLFTAIIAALAIFIGLDLYKRVRRVRYREEVRAEIAAELEVNENPEA